MSKRSLQQVVVRLKHNPLGDRNDPRIHSVLHSLRLRGVRGGAAALDADGTLWGGDVGEGFFQWMLSERHYPKQRIPGLTKAWRRYQRGQLAGERMYELMVTSLEGMQESTVAQLAQRYFDSHHRNRIYRPAAQLVDGLRPMGVEPWVVSGSPYWVVAAGARHLGIPADRVIGLRVKVDRNGRLTGELERPVPWMHGKAKRILAEVGQKPVLAAGNSYGDIQMLSASDMALVINPGPKVARQAARSGWTIRHMMRRDEAATP